MNSYEKYGKMLSLEPYKDRSEMPVFPMMLASYGALGDVLQKDIISSADKWIEAIDNTLAKIGHPDVSMNMCPGDTAFVMGLPSRLPGIELGDNDLYQFVETPYIKSPDEYKQIMEMGWQQWSAKRSFDVHKNHYPDPAALGARYAEIGQNMGKTMAALAQRGMVPCFDGSAGAIFDGLSLARSMAEFTYDLVDCPELIIDIIRKYQPISDAEAVKTMKATGGKRAAIYAMRSSATFISPDMFEEIVWPSLKQTILTLHEAGIVSILHADGNWLPMIKYFTELPKGCLHIELDGDTNIEEAYGMLCGYQSIRGDVPSTLFAFGTPDQVREYCEKLINMGMKGGFMLSSGCEIPLNAKLENVKAMMDSMK